MNERKCEVLVAMQQALLGAVSSRLRAVTVTFTDTSLQFICYYDQQITDLDKEAISEVETELIAYFPDAHDISYEIVQLDFPKQIPKDCSWIYYRSE